MYHIQNIFKAKLRMYGGVIYEGFFPLNILILIRYILHK